ncbi:methyltransferase [Kitasatospora sp. NPDC056446]|uniref:methyltransferase family protein n=1 Tax=Kitasatospora sp. NPDC056446 TaxID=3345819 RepID=UPI0036C9E702
MNGKQGPAGPGGEGLSRERLFGMMAGFKATAALRAAIDLRIFDELDDGPLDAAGVAARLGADGRGVRLMLRALTGLGLLTALGDGRYALAPGTAELLVTTSPGYCGGIVDVAAGDVEWRALGDLAGTVRTGGPVPGADALAPGFPFWVDFARHTTFVTERVADVVAEELAGFAADRPGLRVLEVGCGHGVTGFELAARHPGARVWAQDWPEVLAAARGHAERRGVADRVAYLPGDAFTVPLGGPYDVVVAANLLFHFDRARSARLLERLTGVLAPGGRLVVAGFAPEDGREREQVQAHLLGLLLLSTTPGGEPYSPDDYRELLTGAGLVDVELHTRPGLLPVALTARRP